MTGSWQLRAAELGDLETIVAILRAEDLLYRGRSEIDLGYVQAQIAADHSFDAARDIIVAERAGQVIGSAIVNPRSLNITVDPSHDSSELRRSLLGWGERRQAELGRRPFRIAVAAANTPAVAACAAAGYRRERFYAAMVRDCVAPEIPRPELPSGYQLRPIDRASDVPALHRLDERAFSQASDYLPEGVQEYEKRHIALSGFAEAWSLIISAPDGAAAGSLVGRHRPDPSVGYIAILAVDPAHQRRGLGTALLLSAFSAIQANGCTSAELHVASDNPRALDLYTSVGMHERERFDHYVREPTPGTQVPVHAARTRESGTI